MSSILNRGLNRANNESTTPSRAQLWEKAISLASQASLLLVPVGLAGLIALSVMNDKLFFSELLLSSFIVLALMFFKASAAPRK